MPAMTEIIANPAFKPVDAAQAKVFEAVKKTGTMSLDYITALENIRQSGGMYAFVAAEAEVNASAPRTLEDMTSEELKILMLQSGVTPQKQMKRAEVIKAIRLAMDAVTIEDDEKVAV